MRAPTYSRALAKAVDLVGDMGSVKTVEGLIALGERALRPFGIGPMMAGRRIGIDQEAQEGVLFCTYPAGWLERYFSGRYWRWDPAIQFSRRTTTPFRWHDARGDGPPEKIAQLWMEAETFGLVDGVVVPVFGPDGFSGTVSFVSAAPLPEDRRLDAVAHVVALAMHGRACQILDLPRFGGGADGFHLTLRECDCLRWAADGKTDWEIAQILRISESTVHFHIENAKRKCGAQSRIQVIVRAMQLGLLNT